uniref:Galactosylgalactosylxylosylprotein 3-beta-glucuronosyltransferase n=2 Tax=Parascaris univalens TaxID=6257 RepID=A0A914ZM43_PARUN
MVYKTRRYGYRFSSKLYFLRKRAHIRRMLLMIKPMMITIATISTLAIIILIRLNPVIFSNRSEEANEIILHDGVYSTCSASFRKLLPPAKIERPLIIVVTFTYPRPTRIPDMIRLSQTLMNIRNIAWIVVEDGKKFNNPTHHLIRRTQIAYCYIAVGRLKTFPVRGWSARDYALKFILRRFANFSNRAVVYFADDDNTYDIRLFDRFIRKVEAIGVWAVGLVAGQIVEAIKHSAENIVNGWLNEFSPKHNWEINMASFAINLRILLRNKKNASSLHNSIAIIQKCVLLIQKYHSQAIYIGHFPLLISRECESQQLHL